MTPLHSRRPCRRRRAARGRSPQSCASTCDQSAVSTCVCAVIRRVRAVARTLRRKSPHANAAGQVTRHVHPAGSEDAAIERSNRSCTRDDIVQPMHRFALPRMRRHVVQLPRSGDRGHLAHDFSVAMLMYDAVHPSGQERHELHRTISRTSTSIRRPRALAARRTAARAAAAPPRRGGRWTAGCAQHWLTSDDRKRFVWKWSTSER